jgi:hypothetical protein
MASGSSTTGQGWGTIVNVEYVFFVADDFAYVPCLQALKDKGLEIIVFQRSENAGSRMYCRYNWANIET